MRAVRDGGGAPSRSSLSPPPAEFFSAPGGVRQCREDGMRALLSAQSGSGALCGRSDCSFRHGRRGGSTGRDGYKHHPRQDGAGRASVPAQPDSPTHAGLGSSIGSWRGFCGAVLDGGLWRFASRESSVWITCGRKAAAVDRAPVGHPPSQYRLLRDPLSPHRSWYQALWDHRPPSHPASHTLLAGSSSRALFRTSAASASRPCSASSCGERSGG